MKTGKSVKSTLREGPVAESQNFMTGTNPTDLRVWGDTGRSFKRWLWSHARQSRKRPVTQSSNWQRSVLNCRPAGEAP